MDEDASLFSGFSGWPQEQNNPGLSLEISDNGMTSDYSSRATCSSNATEKPSKITNTHNCGKCLQLELELKKTKIEVLNLKKRCHNKAAEIKRIRASEQRSKSSKCSLEEMVRGMKQKNWITDEGQVAMNVNKLDL